MSRDAFERWAADKTFLIKAGDDYVNVKQMAWEAWQAALESQQAQCPYIETSGMTSWCRLAAQPQVPEGFGLIPLDMRYAEPKARIENGMKHQCMGEFSWQEEAPYYDEDGELHEDYVATHVVPWDICKDIYQKMARIAMLSAQENTRTDPAVPDGEALIVIARLADALQEACNRNFISEFYPIRIEGHGQFTIKALLDDADAMLAQATKESDKCPD